jgi:hypothetical protein
VQPERPLVAKDGTAWIMAGNFAWMSTSTLHFRDLLDAANLRHGTDGFTSSPKEGVLRIFICQVISFIYLEILLLVAFHFNFFFILFVW